MAKEPKRPAFKDNRNIELYEKIAEVIYEYAGSTKMTLGAVVGVMEHVKFDLINDGNIED